MKKKLLYILFLLVVGLAVVYIIRYKTGPCICDSIPKSADAVVFVNIRNLEHHLLYDVLAHPRSYFGSGDSKKEDSLSQTEGTDGDQEQTIRLKDCISIPKFILFYKTEISDGQWISANIDIKDQSKLEDYLSASDFIKSHHQKGISFSRSRQHILINDGRVKLSYGPLDFKTLALKEELGGFMSKGDALFDELNSASGDAVYLDDKGQELYLKFEGGSINIVGQYQLAALQQSTKILNTDGIGALSATFNIEELKALLSADQKDKFTNFTKLQIDSLQQHWDGSFNAVLHGMSVSSDTIKTYEYDDNFDKIEVQKIEEAVTPNYSVHLGVSEEGVSYMKRKKAIVEQDNADILAIMPLAKTFCKTDGKTLSLFTTERHIELENSTDKLNGFLDVQKYLAVATDGLLPFADRIKDMKYMELVISNDNRISAKFLFEGRRNALATLIN